MIKKKIVLMALAICSMTALFETACYKGTTVDLRGDLEITADVGYATDVLPIFEKNCSLSGCHNSGGISPDLSSANAFSSLNSGGYLDVGNPSNSKLYGYVSGKLTPAMPISGADPAIAATILAWINQGAQNN